MGRWEWDITSNGVHWDAVMSALMGLPPETFAGRYGDLIARVFAEDRPATIQNFGRVLDTRAPLFGEFRVIWPTDSSVHRIRVHMVAHFDEHGKPRTVSGSCWNADSSPAAHPPDLADSNAIKHTLLAALMEHLPDNIYFKDLESRFIAVSRSMAEWFGLRNPRELIGKSDFDLFSWEHAQAAMDAEKEIIRTGRPLINQEEKETWPDGRETWVSTSKLPLCDGEGKIIGTFGLSRDLTDRKVAEQQLAHFAAELRAKNEALQEELSMARELQSTMLPQHYPRFGSPGGAGVNGSAVHFHHFYQPSTAVSGDFFDVFKISENQAGLFICDVMGHGVRAALVAATTRALVGELRSKWTEPGAFMEELNRVLRYTLRNNRTPLFASAFYMAVDLSSGQLHYTNAGHPRPFLIHPEGGASRKPAPLDGKNGPALGLFDGAAFPVYSCPVTANDTVLLFTDGLFEVEGADGQVYDYQRLLSAVERRSAQPMKELCHGIVDEVQQFSASKEFSDDVCLLAMQVERLIA